MLITIINSISVNPRLRFLPCLVIYQSLYFVPSSAVALRLGVHIEHVCRRPRNPSPDRPAWRACPSP